MQEKPSLIDLKARWGNKGQAMSDEQILEIQLMMAPVFGCSPEDIEVGEGYARPKKQPERLNEKVHTWTVDAVECDSPNKGNK